MSVKFGGIALLLILIGLWIKAQPHQNASIHEVSRGANGIYIIEGYALDQGDFINLVDGDSSISVFGDIESGSVRATIRKSGGFYSLVKSEPLTREDDIRSGTLTGRVRVSDQTLMGEVDTDSGKVWIHFSDERGIY